MTQVEDHGSYIVKTEAPGFPEAEQYRALNAAGAPVVKLLDVIEEGQGRKIVIEKAAPLSLDTSKPEDFNRVVAWIAEFNSTQVETYPPCNLVYTESYWRISAQLLAQALEPTSVVFRPQFELLPSAAYILAEYRRLVGQSSPSVSHGDPANGNLGTVDGRIVAFDLELSWFNSPLVDLVLRTGAQVTRFSPDIDRVELVENYAQTLGLSAAAPWNDYNICGAIYGSYFELEALDEIRSGRPSAPVLDWANITLDRFAFFAGHIEI
jgi:hypothetical protein